MNTMYPQLTQGSQFESQMTSQRTPTYVVPRRNSAKRARASAAGRATGQKLVIPRGYQPLVSYKTPLPMRFANQHRYVEEVQIVTDGSGFGYYQFACNGLYDPNITGLGHQPLYFDQLAALYNHYHVVKSSIKVTAVRVGTANDVNLALYIDDDTTVTATALSTIAERPGAVMWHAFPSAGIMTFRRARWNAQAMFGGDVMDNDTLKGTASANPTELSFYTIAVDGPGSSNVNISVEIIYDVVWSELKSQAQS